MLLLLLLLLLLMVVVQVMVVVAVSEKAVVNSFDWWVVGMGMCPGLLWKKYSTRYNRYHNLSSVSLEVGRWENIPRSERKWYLCDYDVIGDEYHFLFECYFFRNKRCQYLPKYYYIRPNVIKYHDLFCSTNITLLNNTRKFLDNIMKTFVPPR